MCVTRTVGRAALTGHIATDFRHVSADVLLPHHDLCLAFLTCTAPGRGAAGKTLGCAEDKWKSQRGSWV